MVSCQTWLWILDETFITVDGQECGCVCTEDTERHTTFTEQEQACVHHSLPLDTLKHRTSLREDEFHYETR